MIYFFVKWMISKTSDRLSAMYLRANLHLSKTPRSCQPSSSAITHVAAWEQAFCWILTKQHQLYSLRNTWACQRFGRYAWLFLGKTYMETLNFSTTPWCGTSIERNIFLSSSFVRNNNAPHRLRFSKRWNTLQEKGERFSKAFENNNILATTNSTTI